METLIPGVPKSTEQPRVCTGASTIQRLLGRNRKSRRIEYRIEYALYIHTHTHIHVVYVYTHTHMDIY